jgi:4-amino-4-deoxy-L-arabinose transferase-like glycosyltransferase
MSYNRIFVFLILLILFFLRVWAARDYWNWFDQRFPETWQHSRIVLSQDESQYLQQAAVNQWYPAVFSRWREFPYYRPPLASYYFTWLFTFCGFDRLAAAAVQGLLAVTAYLLIYRAASLLLGSGIGLASLVLTGIHPVLIYYDHSFEDSTPALLLLSGTLVLFLKARSSRWGLLALTGLCGGLTLLARPNLAVVLLCLAAYLCFAARPRPARAMLALLVPALLAVSPAVWHNYQKTGHLVFVTNTTGENLFWGNNENPRWRIMLQGFWYIPFIDQGSPGRLLAEAIMNTYRAPTLDQSFGQAALAYAGKHPAAAAQGLVQKLVRHLSGYEIPRNENFIEVRATAWPYRLPRIPYALVLGFALVGAYALRTMPAQWTILLFPWIAVLVTEVLFFNAGRYRALAIPFLMPVAVAGFRSFVEMLVQQRWKSLLAAVLLIAALAFAGLRAVPKHEQQQFMSASFFKAALMEAFAVRPARDLALYSEARFCENLQKSLSVDPDNLASFDVLQKYLIWKGRTGEAAENIAKKRLACAAEDWLCRAVCDHLEALITQSVP